MVREEEISLPIVDIKKDLIFMIGFAIVGLLVILLLRYYDIGLEAFKF